MQTTLEILKRRRRERKKLVTWFVLSERSNVQICIFHIRVDGLIN